MKKFTNEEIDFIKENYNKMTANEIGRSLNRTANSIMAKAKRLKLPSKMRTFNKDYFKNINTPEKAYWIGFIYADGYIIDNPKNRNYEFSMELKREDKYVLEHLNNCLGGCFKVTDKTSKEKYIKNYLTPPSKSSIIRTYSKDFVKDLETAGIVQNKTNSDIYPIVQNNLFYDFLRGYIDGDGSITLYENKKVNIKYLRVKIISKNIFVLKYIQEKLSNDNIKSYIYKDRTSHFIQINSSYAEKLLNKIYQNKNVFKLERKFKIYQEYLSLPK